MESMRRADRTFRGRRFAPDIVRGFLVLVLAAAVGACATKHPPAPQSAGISDYSYRIGPLDVINVIVWRNPDLSQSMPVRPDGKITTPLVDDMQAIGKTPSELERDIE